MAIFSKTASNSPLSAFSKETQTFVKTQIYPRLLELNGWECPILKKKYTVKLSEIKTLKDICEACGSYLMFIVLGVLKVKMEIDDFHSTKFGDLSYLLKLLSIYYNLFMSFQFLRHNDGLFTGLDSRILVHVESCKMTSLTLAYDYCEKIHWDPEEGIDDMPAFLELYMKEAFAMFLPLNIGEGEVIDIKETVFL